MDNRKHQSSLTYDELYEIAARAVIEKNRKGEELTNPELDLLFEQVSPDFVDELSNAVAGIPHDHK